MVSASVGKHVRAEPISAMYERGMVHHVGDFPKLERELINFTTVGYKGRDSPNRADALVWACTELFGRNLSHDLTDYLAAEQGKIDAEREERMQSTATRLTRGTSLTKIETTPEEGKQPSIGCPECGGFLIQRLQRHGGDALRCGNCGKQWDETAAPALTDMRGVTRTPLAFPPCRN
ncbi:MAG TPA: hypothetical protein VNY05_32455 [Candidatus Acidoferrales bacterium]|jgi:hypothetical protein|nr:hypothetical protein [Candidatus Acidoferrales bacterium]